MVEAGPVSTARASSVDLELDQRLVSVTDDDTANDRLLRTRTNQRCIGCYPMRAERGQIAGGFDQVRLALTIEPDQRGDPGRQRQLGAWVAAKVGDAQMPQVHGGGRSVISQHAGLAGLGDCMSAELVAQRCHGLHLWRVILA